MRYDYQCNACNEIFEVVKSYKDTSPTPCQTCDSKSTRRVILTTPLIYVSWRNTMGLGSSGQLVLASVKNGTRPGKKARRKPVRRKHYENELQ